MQVCALFSLLCSYIMLIVRQLLTHLLILFYAKYQFMLSFLIKIPLISLLFIYVRLLVGMDGQQVFPYIQSAWDITTGFSCVCFLFYFRLVRFVETFLEATSTVSVSLLFIFSLFFIIYLQLITRSCLVSDSIWYTAKKKLTRDILIKGNTA